MNRKAVGPGTLWLSVAETKRLLDLIKKNKTPNIEMLPPGPALRRGAPDERDRPLWQSEAGLFLRWGLMGPGQRDPVESRAFLELVQRARREPITEGTFISCFGFGYATMEEKLTSFLKKALAATTAIDDLPFAFPSGDPCRPPHPIR